MGLVVKALCNLRVLWCVCRCLAGASPWLGLHCLCPFTRTGTLGVIPNLLNLDPNAKRQAKAALVTHLLVTSRVQTSLEHRRHKVDPTLLGLQEMLTYGLRGLCAYTHHAEVLGQRNADVDAFVAEAYAFLCSEDAQSVDKVLGMVLKCGETNLTAMQILDAGHTTK